MIGLASREIEQIEPSECCWTDLETNHRIACFEHDFFLLSKVQIACAQHLQFHFRCTWRCKLVSSFSTSAQSPF